MSDSHSYNVPTIEHGVVNDQTISHEGHGHRELRQAKVINIKQGHISSDSEVEEKKASAPEGDKPNPEKNPDLSLENHQQQIRMLKQRDRDIENQLRIQLMDRDKTQKTFRMELDRMDERLKFIDKMFEFTELNKDRMNWEEFEFKVRNMIELSFGPTQRKVLEFQNNLGELCKMHQDIQKSLQNYYKEMQEGFGYGPGQTLKAQIKGDVEMMS